MPASPTSHTAGTPGRERPRPAGRALVAAAALLLAVTAGCASTQSSTVTRTGSRDLNSSGEGYIGGQSLTQISPGERKAAPVAEGTSLDGDPVSTADYLGKVVVVNVWGSWCGPCRVEAKDLAEASEETSDIARFVGINIRDAEPEQAQAFVRAFDVPYPSIFDPQGRQLLKFAGTLPPNGIPTTLVIDTEGRIAARIVGVVSKTTLVQLIEDTEQGR
jgi:thiol-disulfide isomerase/thioredoxin